MSSDDPEAVADAPATGDTEANDPPPAPKDKKGAESSNSGTKKSKKSKSGEKSKNDTFLSTGTVVEWESNGETLGLDENWATEDLGSASPSVWDPKQFDEQTGNLDPWKESTEVTRVQDLPSPLLAEAPPEQRTGDEDEWPFKSPCSFQEKKRRRRYAHSSHSVSSDIDSVGSPRAGVLKSRGESPRAGRSPRAGLKSKESPRAGKSPRAGRSKSKESPRAGRSKSKTRKGKKDDAPALVQRSSSTDGDDDIIDDDDDSRHDAWKMRESWKSSAHSESEMSKSSKGSKEGRRGRKKDSEPSMPRRSRGPRPDADEDMDQPPGQPKGRSSSRSDDEGINPDDDGNGDDSEKPKKSKRKSGKGGSEEGGGDGADDAKDELGNSFHRLAKDFDKPSKPRSSSRNRKTKAPGSGSGRRRRLKDRGMDHSGHDDDNSEVYEEFGEEEHEIKLKEGDNYSISDPGSGGSRSRMTWRERRARNRLGEDPSGDGPEHTVAPLKAPGSGGRRPARRAMMRRASSERWMRAVEGEDNPDAIQNRARATLRDANAELSRSAHSIRRYHSGGVGAMAAGLDARSYHGPTETRRQPLRTPRKQIRGTHSDSADSGELGNDYDDYELNLSGRSARTLDSIEDLEDFEHLDFQTPGMVDYDEEILDLMQRANPEHTAQLNRRVHRKREAVNYDQNMPMMTRQALLTRQASAQVARQRFDGSNIDRQRLLLRSDSMSSTDGAAELSMSNHRGMRTAGGRRPPPRTRSSGMAAIARNDVPAFMQQQPARPTDPENRRGVFRTRSSTSSFKQYYNKPNRVAQLSRRGPGSGDQIDPHSMRGPSSSSASSGTTDRRASLQRAKSTTALRPTKKLDPRGVPADRDDDDEMEHKKEDAREMKTKSSEADESKKKKKDTKDDDDDDDDDDSLQSESEDSDVESIETETVSPRKPARRKPTKTLQPKSPLPTRAKKSTDKRDMLVKRNRCKLHAMMYEVKMGVDMKDLFVEVQKGEIPKSPIKSLMMPSP